MNCLELALKTFMAVIVAFSNMLKVFATVIHLPIGEYLLARGISCYNRVFEVQSKALTMISSVQFYYPKTV
jgi:hypothetical protein